MAIATKADLPRKMLLTSSSTVTFARLKPSIEVNMLEKELVFFCTVLQFSLNRGPQILMPKAGNSKF